MIILVSTTEPYVTIQEEDGDHAYITPVPNIVEDSVNNEVNTFEVKEEISIDEHEICLQNIDTVM